MINTDVPDYEKSSITVPYLTDTTYYKVTIVHAPISRPSIALPIFWTALLALFSLVIGAFVGILVSDGRLGFSSPAKSTIPQKR